MFPERDQFWPQGHNLNKLGSGPLGYATYNILRLKSLWSLTRRFYHVFPISICKTCDPGAGPFLWPQGHNLNKLGKAFTKDPLGDTTYQI